MYLGESIAPFRVLEPQLAVIPWDVTGGRLIDSASAQAAGYPNLARWLQQAGRLWNEHGRGGMTFLQQIDYYGKLTAQFPIAPLRVVYSKAGTLPACATIRSADAAIDHKLYWAVVNEDLEARYLMGIFNSDCARSRVESLQSSGQWGPRDFDKLMLGLPIPEFDARLQLHRDLAAAAARAEEVASDVQLDEARYFTRLRQDIRQALAEDGIAADIEALVEDLLGPAF